MFFLFLIELRFNTFVIMRIEFYKYQGTGNDFIIIDNRSLGFPKNNTKLVSNLCDRNFGIGADGLMLLENHPTHDFTMVYYNADGHPSSMCGNGGRCLVHFAKYLGLVSSQAVFEAADGVHEASIEGGIVSLKMSDVSKVINEGEYLFLDTGSPHHVELVDNTQDIDVFYLGRNIRNQIYGTEGANVNFVAQTNPTTFSIRTYERGVENETLSCGTGVTAAAIAMHYTKQTDSNKINLNTMGGNLEVSFTHKDGIYTNVCLKGPAVQVFKGFWDL